MQKTQITRYTNTHKIYKLDVGTLMVHSDFINVHRSTSANTSLSQQLLSVANICARKAGSHAKDKHWQTSADAKRCKSERSISTCSV